MAAPALNLEEYKKNYGALRWWREPTLIAHFVHHLFHKLTTDTTPSPLSFQHSLLVRPTLFQGCGIPTWSPLYHEPPEGATKANPNLVGGVLLPPTMRHIDKDAITFGLDALRGKNGREKLGWSAQETAAGCRIRDYGSGVPHWSPLYGGSSWRAKEIDQKLPRFKDFKTGEVHDCPSHEREAKAQADASSLEQENTK